VTWKALNVGAIAYASVVGAGYTIISYGAENVCRRRGEPAESSLLFHAGAAKCRRALLNDLLPAGGGTAFYG